MAESFKPYVPANKIMPELTVKSITLGLVMAIILGAANAYLGLKAGMTISAAFPAAVIAIAVFRIPFLKGNILEQNIARTTASVGEALAAGAIFTIPAFLMIEVDGVKLWEEFHYWESTIVLLVGGVLGVLFVTLLRKTLTIDADLPYPEGRACLEIVRAGQKGSTGAKWVFGSMGVAALIEFFKNGAGIPLIKESVEYFIQFPKSVIHHINFSRESIGDITHTGGFGFATPVASPAMISVGFLIGPRIAATNFAGSIFAWLIFIPMFIFMNPELRDTLGGAAGPIDWEVLSFSIWYNQVRPLGVGIMLVGSFFTLWGLRNSLGGAFKGIFGRHEHHAVEKTRIEKDLNLKWVFISSLILVIPMFFIFKYFTGSIGGAILAAVIMTILGFLFAAVGGWLVGIVGNSNQPVSGLTVSTLIIAALLMLAIGIKGLPGIAAVLAIATVVCCIACIAGDMIQDLWVGHRLGGTPWKMEVSEIIGAIVVAFVIIFPIMMFHKANIMSGGIGIGDPALPAPQAGIMAQLAKGIVGGEMPYGLILAGMFFAIGLIMVGIRSVMVVGLGVYLPFEVTFAFFVGGVIKWAVTKIFEKRNAGAEDYEKRRNSLDNKGILVASGFIAGEALMSVVLATLVFLNMPSIIEMVSSGGLQAFVANYGGWTSIVLFIAVIAGLGYLPLRSKAK